jgi:hypothetical protein
MWESDPEKPRLEQMDFVAAPGCTVAESAMMEAEEGRRLRKKGPRCLKSGRKSAPHSSMTCCFVRASVDNVGPKDVPSGNLSPSLVAEMFGVDTDNTPGFAVANLVYEIAASDTRFA